MITCFEDGCKELLQKRREVSPPPYRRNLDIEIFYHSNTNIFMPIGVNHIKVHGKESLYNRMELLKNLLGRHGISYHNTISDFRIMCRLEKDSPELYFEILIWSFLEEKTIIDFKFISGDVVLFEDIFKIILQDVRQSPYISLKDIE